jgi:hypothetical protein
LRGAHAHQPGYARLQHAYAAAADRTHRIFLVAGHAQLTYQEDIEFDPEPLCDGEPNWHSATRQRQHDRVRAPGKLPQLAGQQLAGLRAVLETAEIGHAVLLSRFACLPVPTGWSAALPRFPVSWAA